MAPGNPRNVQLTPRGIPYKVQIPLAFGILAAGIYAEWLVACQESHRMSRFRDKSALFGKELGPNDPPSWGPPGPYKNRNNENTPSNYN